MSSYNVSRSTTIDADAERVHALVNDFHEWTTWSPWEDLDPKMSRTYSGPQSGPGARYEWHGNRKAGVGSQQITSSTPEGIDIDLSFLKPFKSKSHVHFTFAPMGSGTEVTWQMDGEQHGLMGVFGKVVPMDKLVGKDFEKGLARLKAVAEQS
jgi:hypothetical protein